jgi:hypothetical protein
MTHFKSWLYSALILTSSTGFSAPAMKPPPATSVTATTLASDKKTGCAVIVPLSWGTKTLSWNGSCQKKRANGNGVAKLYSDGKIIATWYGDVRSGHMEYGALERSGAFEHGKMLNGKFVDADTLWKENKEPGIDAVSQAMNKAMSRGSLAAQTYADQLAKVGNKASAAFYRKKAEEIDLLQGE